jgi:hypothetical protein
MFKRPGLRPVADLHKGVVDCWRLFFGKVRKARSQADALWGVGAGGVALYAAFNDKSGFGCADVQVVGHNFFAGGDGQKELKYRRRNEQAFYYFKKKHAYLN